MDRDEEKVRGYFMHTSCEFWQLSAWRQLQGMLTWHIFYVTFYHTCHHVLFKWRVWIHFESNE